jgi:hypothetical protein
MVDCESAAPMKSRVLAQRCKMKVTETHSRVRVRNHGTKVASYRIHRTHLIIRQKIPVPIGEMYRPRRNEIEVRQDTYMVHAVICALYSCSVIEICILQ